MHKLSDGSAHLSSIRALQCDNLPLNSFEMVLSCQSFGVQTLQEGGQDKALLQYHTHFGAVQQSAYAKR